MRGAEEAGPAKGREAPARWNYTSLQSCRFSGGAGVGQIQILLCRLSGLLKKKNTFHMSLFESINVEFVAANGPCIANITQEWREINVIL
jgi:hypothetical protein